MVELMQCIHGQSVQHHQYDLELGLPFPLPQTLSEYVPLSDVSDHPIAYIMRS